MSISMSESLTSSRYEKARMPPMVWSTNTTITRIMYCSEERVNQSLINENEVNEMYREVTSH